VYVFVFLAIQKTHIFENVKPRLTRPLVFSSELFATKSPVIQAVITGRHFAENTEFIMYTNEFLCRRWVNEVWNQGCEDSIDELFSEDGHAVYPNFVAGDDTLVGRAEFKRFYRAVRQRFENLNIRLSDVSSDEDKVVAICNVTGTLRSEFQTAPGEVAVRCLCLYKFRDGKIQEIWNNVELDESQMRKFRLNVARD
jgi:predicted ester cyclase